MLSSEEQFKKIGRLHKIANTSVKSKSLVMKLGGITIYAALTDFYAIQAARLIEQVILKGELLQKNEPSFKPRDDTYFYDKQISTRTIVKKIKSLLPFKYKEDAKKEKQINAVAMGYLKKTEIFLNYRNSCLHHLANPKISEQKIIELIDKSINSFKEMIISHNSFFTVWQPYRFGTKEIQYFYGESK